MNETRRQVRPLRALKTTLEAAYYWLRKVIGLAYSVLMRDSLASLRVEMQELSSAAVESTSYVGAELRSVEERLARLEEELAEVRELLEQQQPVSGRSQD